MALYNREKTGAYLHLSSPFSRQYNIPLVGVGVHLDVPTPDFSFGFHIHVAFAGFSISFGKDSNYRGIYAEALDATYIETDSQA